MAGVFMGGLGFLAPFAVFALLDDPGATIGAGVAGFVLAGCAAVVWPWAWSPEERRHHELSAIWEEARADGAERVPWDRFAAWARTDGGDVELALLRLAGGVDAPSPLSMEAVQRIDPDRMDEAAGAMEALHDRAGAMEARAREEYLQTQSAEERRVHDEALRRIDRSAEEHQRRAEERMRQELAAEEDAERRAQAAALARALRRR